MAIKLDMGSLLAEGVLGGIAGYAGEIGAEHKAARASEAAQALEQMKTDSAMRVEAAKQMMAKDSYDTFPTTDAQGNSVQQTVRSHFNPNKNNGTGTPGGYDTEIIGSGPVQGKTPEIKPLSIGGGMQQDFTIKPDGSKGNPVGEPRPIFDPKVVPDPMAGMAKWMQQQVIETAQREKAAAEERNARATSQAVSSGRNDYNELQTKLIDPINSNEAVAMKARAYAQNQIDPADPNAEALLKQAMTNSYAASLGAKPVAGVKPAYDPNTMSTTRGGKFAGTVGNSAMTEDGTAPPDSGSGWSAKPNAHGAVVATGTNAAGQRVAKYADGTIAPLPAAGP